jgi:hypothetical protein
MGDGVRVRRGAGNPRLGVKAMGFVVRAEGLSDKHVWVSVRLSDGSRSLSARHIAAVFATPTEAQAAQGFESGVTTNATVVRFLLEQQAMHSDRSTRGGRASGATKTRLPCPESLQSRAQRSAAYRGDQPTADRGIPASGSSGNSLAAQSADRADV